MWNISKLKGFIKLKTMSFVHLQGFIRFELMCVDQTISNWYDVQKGLFIDSIRRFVNGEANYASSVNA